MFNESSTELYRVLPGFFLLLFCGGGVVISGRGISASLKVARPWAAVGGVAALVRSDILFLPVASPFRAPEAAFSLAFLFIRLFFAYLFCLVYIVIYLFYMILFLFI